MKNTNTFSILFWLKLANAMAVGMVTKCPIKIMRSDPMKPTDPIAKPNRRNITAPKIVEIAVKNTGSVVNFDFCSIKNKPVILDTLIYQLNEYKNCFILQ